TSPQPKERWHAKKHLAAVAVPKAKMERQNAVVLFLLCGELTCRHCSGGPPSARNFNQLFTHSHGLGCCTLNLRVAARQMENKRWLRQQNN
ncbi:hypothetical protein, partial [Klebsiella variicola]|uniref:hypothetical protein n=1 Tax=Klebsiella variicola TaxID=244366 RepID=UPI001C6443B2